MLWVEPGAAASLPWVEPGVAASLPWEPRARRPAMGRQTLESGNEDFLRFI